MVLATKIVSSSFLKQYVEFIYLAWGLVFEQATTWLADVEHVEPLALAISTSQVLSHIGTDSLEFNSF